MFLRVLILTVTLAAPLTSQVKFSELRGVGFIRISGYLPHMPSQYLGGGLAWGDIDGDGDMDALGGPLQHMHKKDQTFSIAWVLLNDGAGDLKDVSYSYSQRSKQAVKIWGTGTILLIDMDGDGDLDQIVGHNPLANNSTLENARFLKNNGRGFFSDATKSLNMPRLITPWVVPIHANKDRALDLIFVAWDAPSVLLMNDGKGVFQPSKTTGWPSYKGKGALVGDFDKDGDEDVVFIVENKDKANAYFLNDGKGNFSAASKKTFPAPAEMGASGAVGDLDGDGDLDLLFGQYRGDLIMRPDRILWNDGKGNFAMTTLPGIKGVGTGGRPFTTYSIALGDVDGDGDLDLVMGYAGSMMSTTVTNTTRIYENLGKRQFREFSGAIFEPGWTHRVTLVDFDHDGDLDLLSSKSWFITPPNHAWMNLTRQVHFREPPQIGRTLLLDVYSSRKGVVTANYVGLKRSKLALAPMGNWWLAPSTMFYAGSSLFFQQSGKQTLSLPIPWNTYLIGLELHAQSIYYDSARRTLRFSNLMREKINQ